MKPENNLGQVVGTCFIRICKDNDKYETLKKQINPSKNVFVDAWGETCSNIFETFDKNDKHIRELVSDNKDYRMVVELVNQMLKYYLDRNGDGGGNPQKLQMIGESVFNMSCYKMYGKKFLDDLAKHKANKPSFDDFCHMQWQQFCCHHRHNISFADFMNQYKPNLKEIYNNIK